MKVAVITADYGEYDTVRPATPQEIYNGDLEFIFVTDSRSKAAEAEAVGWTAVYEPRPHVHTCVAAKVPKFRPDLYTNAGYTMWKDAGASIGPRFVHNMLEQLAYADMALFPHPIRTKLADEVAASRGLPKYADLPMEQQIEYYLGGGYPDTQLFATGCIARRRIIDNQAFGDAWMREVVRWGFQDQLSFAFLCWAKIPRISLLAPGLYTSEHIQFGGHIWAP